MCPPRTLSSTSVCRRRGVGFKGQVLSCDRYRNKLGSSTDAQQAASGAPLIPPTIFVSSRTRRSVGARFSLSTACMPAHGSRLLPSAVERNTLLLSNVYSVSMSFMLRLCFLSSHADLERLFFFPCRALRLRRVLPCGSRTLTAGSPSSSTSGSEHHISVLHASGVSTIT